MSALTEAFSITAPNWKQVKAARREFCMDLSVLVFYERLDIPKIDI